MSLKENDIYFEEIAERQLEWLADRGFSFQDVHSDEDGEYVIDEIEGEHGIVESIKKIYLPDFSKEV